MMLGKKQRLPWNLFAVNSWGCPRACGVSEAPGPARRVRAQGCTLSVPVKAAFAVEVVCIRAEFRSFGVSYLWIERRCL